MVNNASKTVNPSTEELTQQTLDTGDMIQLHAENFRECLRSYQRAIIWSLAASFTFLLLSLSLASISTVLERTNIWGGSRRVA